MLRRNLLTCLFLTIYSCAFAADPEPRVEMFSPTGTVKDVRQVTARFSVPMVPFGDPRLTEPFEIDCPSKGTGRWADARNWVFDFDRALPAGVVCTFRLKSDLKTLNGGALSGQRDFPFSTGGPAIRQSQPYEGSSIDEDQVFILGLDASAEPETILANAYCDIEGVQERVGVRFLAPDERKQLLDQRRDFVDRYVRALLIFKRSGTVVPLDTRAVIKGSDIEKFLSAKPEESPIVTLQCQRHLPNNARARLVWGKGIRTASGVATEQDQTLAYRVRSEFRAEFHCERVNAEAQCIPVLPMELRFTAPVTRELASKIEFKLDNGKAYRPQLNQEERQDALINGVSIVGPFPEKSRVTVTLPKDFHDDAGRTLANRDIFPLAVATDEYPPLAKFPARFGIIELNADATLPVTVRNLEAQLKMSLLKVAGADQEGISERVTRTWQSLTGGEKNDAGSISGRALRVWQTADAGPQVIAWLRRLYGREDSEGSQSLFGGENEAKGEPQQFSLPKPGGERVFEVMGIPLKGPGFYVVELTSPRLGAALHGEAKPYYVQTAALVTNLAAHFKRGRESSLVWVTSLDKGMPVAGATVEVLDCNGKVHWSGKTDSVGTARIAQELPAEQTLPGCYRGYNRNYYDRKYFITARHGDDLTFVFSDWNEGIHPWRFHLPTGSYDGSYIATTVFDRTLLRAGDTVHMMHFYRRHTGNGFGLIDKTKLPAKAVISHLGSDQRYEQPLTWNDDGTAEAIWTIPQDAKLGTYQVRLDNGRQGPTDSGSVPTKSSGTFRVEAFRVPTMKAVLKPLQAPLVNAQQAEIDIQLNYLAGGGAGGASVKLRSLIQPKAVSFPDYQGYTLANGNVKEGTQRQGAPSWSYRGYELEDGESGDESVDRETTAAGPGTKSLTTRNIVLDAVGAARVTLDKLPKVETPQTIQAELEYQDANGEVLTSSTRIPLWPAKLIVGLKPDAWAATKDKLKFYTIVLDLNGRPRANTAVKVDLLQRKNYSHRKRLIGGFYAYEHNTEVKRLGDICSGRTDTKGLLVCEVSSPVSGNVILRAQATDEAGNVSYANQDVWVAGKDEWWFDVSNDDRMDVLPEKKRYEPGETAVFQVRMPFREATALVTVEREGVLESFVARLTGKEPVIKVPLKGSYAPNVFVSVLAVRGRAAGVQPTALVDLGKPAFKLGIAEINVGWRAHELKVDVRADRTTYKTRDKAAVRVKVSRADGAVLGRGAEVVLAAVDEGLLELMNNDSWDLLKSMMQRRSIEVQTSTAQMNVIGKRHYGRKALATGGGGGRQVSRELFDTLLLWKGRVLLDTNGEATVEVPLNDSLTSFQIVAVAHAGAGLFGTGQTSIRSTQDVMLLSGLPQLVREQDRYGAGVTVRNSSTVPLDVTMTANYVAAATEPGTTVAGVSLAPITVHLAPGEARAVTWDVTAPVNARKLAWEFNATTQGLARDRMKITQQVIPAVRVRTFQATLAQLDKTMQLPVQIPADAIPGRGGIQLHLQSRLGDELTGVREYMEAYPYTCLEQRASQAIALRDAERWKALMNALPSYLDRDGLAKYFPMMYEGSDTLTSYLLIIADEAGWEIPQATRDRMVKGLTGFVQGRVVRHSALPTADLTLRKLSALNGLARVHGGIEPALISSIALDPNLWPTSGLLDWLDILKRSDKLAERDQRRTEAEQVLRSRLNFQGTTMGFSTERSDVLWWLMCSVDANANRAVLALLDSPAWREDIPRLVRGALGRQHRGRWNTTVANAWGVLAMEKFSNTFEVVPVDGVSRAELAKTKLELKWGDKSKGGTLGFDWPIGQATLDVSHTGSGKPWLTVQSLAAIPLKQPFSTGYKIRRTVVPVEQKEKGSWSRGDVYRVRLDIEAQSDMTWVVVHDPIPSGASILGTGLGRDSQILTRGEKRQGWVWPAFEERTFDSFRAYYEFVPRGNWTVEYTVRLNNGGAFRLPETRVEALYAPEMFGETPNGTLEVKP